MTRGRVSGGGCRVAGMSTAIGTKGRGRRATHIAARQVVRRLHDAAAVLRHHANLIDLAADSPEPGEAVEYLRLGALAARSAYTAIRRP